MTRPAGDLYAAPPALAPSILPDDVAAGLEQLAASPPLWAYRRRGWVDLIARVQAAALRWDVPVRSAGWSTLDLYGLPRAPCARVDAMGAFFLVARPGDRVVLAVDAMEVRTRSGARLRVYRRHEPHPQAVLPWLMPPIGTPRSEASRRLSDFR
jgi:hypothetical protein